MEAARRCQWCGREHQHAVACSSCGARLVPLERSSVSTDDRTRPQEVPTTGSAMEPNPLLAMTPSRPDLPRIVEGRRAAEWWRFLPPKERRALRRAAAAGHAATDPERAAELISFIRRETAPERLIPRAALLPVSVGILMLLMPLPGWLEASWFASAVGSSALVFTASYRHMRRTERLNVEVLQRFIHGEPVVPPPASWSALGPGPRSYRIRRRYMLAEWLLRLLILSSLVFVASWNSGLVRTSAVVVAGALVILALRKTRFAEDVTISPEGIELRRGTGTARRWRWDEIPSVRHIWYATTKQLTIRSPDGVPFIVLASSLPDFDEFLALVLSSVAQDRIDRSPPKRLERLLFGTRVPTRDEDLTQPPPLQGTDWVRACLVTVMILTAGMIVLTAIVRTFSQAVT